ncbi:hypothetical protein EDD21DRAFT_374352 [Dissophora ornata]|nr:hypothetical protein EDD21DRAFT_374352 [Dissophora ornata]
MRMCTMLSWLTRRLVTSMSLSLCTTLTLRLTTSTTAGVRPTISWMDPTRRSNPRRMPSRWPTRRSSTSSGLIARLLLLTSGLTRPSPTRPSRRRRKSRRL